MKAKNLLKKAFLFLALMGGANSAWADDVVTATQTFSADRKTCTWTDLNVTVAKGNTAGGDGLYFTANSDRAISTSSGTVQGGTGAIAVVYVQVVSASSTGTITMISPSNAGDRIMALETYDAETNPDAKVVCSKTGSTATFTTSDVVEYAGGYYVKLTNQNADVKIKSFAITLTSEESYPESVATDPVFTLTETNITTLQTSQIQVDSRGDLNGITLSDITFGTSGIVTVDAETGVITPVTAGTTTITFNSAAVASKYNASTDNELTITVREAVTVFDGDGIYDTEISLEKDDVEYWDYLSTSNASWASRSWSGREGYYLDMKTGRTISITVKNVTALEVHASGSEGRTYTVTVGDNAPVECSQSSGSGFPSSGIITTGTTEQVTITIEGGSSNTVYPVYLIINPRVSATIGEKGYTTFSSSYPLNLSSMTASEGEVTAYSVLEGGITAAEITPTSATGTVAAGEGLILSGTAGATITIPVAASGTAIDGNKMVGCPTGTTITSSTENYSSIYVMTNNDTEAVFQNIKNWIDTESSLAIPAGKAYLQTSGVSLARSLKINFGEVTGVNAVEAASEAALADGKYFENGQIVIVKNGKKYNAAGAQVK